MQQSTCAMAANSLKRLVGARGFEPRTSCAQGRRATRLRYAPTGTVALILKHVPVSLLLQSLQVMVPATSDTHPPINRLPLRLLASWRDVSGPACVRGGSYALARYAFESQGKKAEGKAMETTPLPSTEPVSLSVKLVRPGRCQWQLTGSAITGGAATETRVRSTAGQPRAAFRFFVPNDPCGRGRAADRK